MKITSAHRSGAVAALALTLLASGSAFARTATPAAPNTPTNVAMTTTRPASIRPIGNVGTKAPAGPNFTGAITPQQLTEAYDRWAQQTQRIDPAILHTP